MEFVQFFPIGHLAPRMIGMDPIMWDPFRYKLGGRLLNGNMEEFTGRYGTQEDGRYVITRDTATYAILQEVAAGRGSPHGGAYLSFMHIPAEKLKAAFGPVIEKLAANGIDLSRQPVEVAPIAHYHMGGIAVDETMATGVPQLLAAGEAVGGANGANRLSGNAITEALVFGRTAGRTAVQLLDRGAAFNEHDAAAALAMLEATGPSVGDVNTAAMLSDLQSLMWRDVGPFRTDTGLKAALARIGELAQRLGDAPVGAPAAFDLARLDWLDLRNMLLVARTVAAAALARTESRGAHQRDDYTGLSEDWTRNQTVSLDRGKPIITKGPLLSAQEAAA
jgi:succinate dehydrogenase/fumarate reductase flavoprotein subunit